ncbi:MAG: homoserine dehydrogenase [Proteobacteria bacterium]|nr:homoserine dehydrogenase [Pseudomonadota bacterium]
MGPKKVDGVGVGLIGLGTVGTATVRILIEQADLLNRRLGAPLTLCRVADVDTTRERGLDLPPGLLSADVDGLLGDPDIDVVIELIGGLEPARTYVLQALQNGKHVVTANKALLAEHGAEIFAAAEEHGGDVAFEASVGGGIPLLRSFREGLAGDEVASFFGILNGTCNYILSRMTKEGADYEEVLAEAQSLGLAEADPTLDVYGLDTAHKLAILVGLAFGARVDLADIHVQGIEAVTPLDIKFAAEFGYRLKLLAIARRQGDAVQARVHPTLIPDHHLLADVSGAMNAVYVTGRYVGQLMFYGPGAGGGPTGTAVVADVIELARNRLAGAAGRVPPLAMPWSRLRATPIIPMDRVTTKHYFRFAAIDRPGVLSAVSGILGRHDISIEAVNQKGRQVRGAVPIVMLTHEAPEKNVDQALRMIDELEFIAAPTARLRVEDLDAERPD